MSRWTAFRPLAALLAFVPVLWSVPAVWAQDLIFDEEEIEEIDTSDYLIDEEEVEVIDTETAALPITTGLIIPNDLIPSAQADRLSDVLVDELGEIPTVQAVDNVDLRGEFEVMGADLALECAFDPVCLGRVGWDVGLDRVVIGRASPSRESGAVGFTLDLVDLESRSVLRYRFVEVDDSESAIADAIAVQLPYLFEIREAPPTRPPPPPGPSTAQQVAAWGTLGLGVGALVAGVLFGLDANSTEDDVRNGALREGNIYVATQVEAQAQLDDASDSALLSNIFLGTGIALLGVSALLFLITPGSDIDTEAERVGELERLPTLAPVVTSDGWGVAGGVVF